jgi:hypothetical protein
MLVIPAPQAQADESGRRSVLRSQMTTKKPTFWHGRPQEEDEAQKDEDGRLSRMVGQHPFSTTDATTPSTSFTSPFSPPPLFRGPELRR